MKRLFIAFCLAVALCFVAQNMCSAYGVVQKLQSVSAAQLEQVARVALSQTMQGETRRKEFRFVRATQNLHLPLGHVELKAVLPAGVRFSGTTPVRVQIFLNGVLRRQASVFFEVHVYDTALVATHDLRIDQTLSAEDVVAREVQVPDSNATFVRDLSELNGAVPARMIRSGTPIETAFLQSPIAVVNGTPVTLIANTKGITVKAAGVALQKGRIGKMVRVRNLASGRILYGKVLDKETVEIS